MALANKAGAPIPSYEAFTVADYHNASPRRCHLCGMDKSSYRHFSTGLIVCLGCLPRIKR